MLQFQLLQFQVLRFLRLPGKVAVMIYRLYLVRSNNCKAARLRLPFRVSGAHSDCECVRLRMKEDINLFLAPDFRFDFWYLVR